MRGPELDDQLALSTHRRDVGDLVGVTDEEKCSDLIEQMLKRGLAERA